MVQQKKKHQEDESVEISDKDVYLNLNPDISASIKEYQDSIKAQKLAKESLEKHKHILEQS